MPLTFERAQDALLAIGVFGFVFAAWLAVLILLSARSKRQAEKIGRRLAILDQAEDERVLSLWLDDRVARTKVMRGRRKGALERLDELRMSAGWTMPAASLIGGVALACFTSLSASVLLTRGLLLGLGVSASIVMGFWFFLNHCINRRATIFERQFVDALDLAARSLRAGHPLLGAFRLISEEVSPPVSTVFGDVCQQQALGVSLADALKSVAAKSPTADLKLFATAVIIQLRSGGNLAQMMDRLAHVIRDRMRLGRRVKVLTAQTQFSKRVLISLPFLLFFVLNLMNPGYMNALYDTADGRMVLTLGCGGLLLGIWLTNRMARLRY